MNKIQFQLLLWTLSVLLALFATAPASSSTFVLAQQPTQTSAAASGVFITVITEEPQINVRLGPSSTVYPVVGILLRGATAPVFGRSPGGDWIQIEFPSAPNGRGWVYSPLVQVSPAGVTLQIMEPPPTPVPPATSTIDPTLAAQFIVIPTSTRLPTFTPPPTLVGFDYEPSPPVLAGIPWASMIIAFGVLGITGFLLSLLRR
ncbi:MAG: SH3 domain-containing protein [Chloroflexi bacterium]|nr:SH3 domain-containing protein [Chloroflexota bacterium]